MALRGWFEMAHAIAATATTEFPKAATPTLYFIGVTTGKSSIMTVFPRWAEYLKLGDVRIQGIDVKVNERPEVYRRIVNFIMHDPLSRGALVTTHKIDLLNACRDSFDELDSYARLLGEISAISKRDGKLTGHAKDPISSVLAMEAFVPPDHFQRTDADLLILGAGGASIAFSSYLMDPKRRTSDRPSRIAITDTSSQRLEEIRRVHRELGWPSSGCSYHCIQRPDETDSLISSLKHHSLVVNATGLGKDAPGSPVTDSAIFPMHGYVWDFNYRGELIFLDQARRQEEARSLRVEDGWVYFLHGWTRAIAEIFHIDIPTSGPVFEELSRIAKEAR
jgi:shikimate 5-dehydrogenase